MMQSLSVSGVKLPDFHSERKNKKAKKTHTDIHKKKKKEVVEKQAKKLSNKYWY